MKVDPHARLLDLTRLTRRAGRRMTGVDRVEYAYLDHLLAAPVPLFGLVRTSLGFVLLDRSGCAELRDRINADDWEPGDLLGRLRGGDPARARGEAAVRRLALSRCPAVALGGMLRRHLPSPTQYFNTGHSNLTAPVLRALRQVSEMRIAVLVHDTIPLDFPQYQRPETRGRFADFLQRATRQADLVICNSDQTRADVLRHADSWGAAPICVVAHLGVAMPTPGAAPPGPWQTPYFVALGTIEPRKNHALLLDLWHQMGLTAPDLIIIGARGWENQDVLNRLDRAPPRIHEVNHLDDSTVFAFLAGSAGLLFPSHAEGYGLPPIEAAALGVPVVCNDLAVYREVLGDIPVYAAVNDQYLWRETITRLAARPRAGRQKSGAFVPPGWQAHFNIVLRSI